MKRTLLTVFQSEDRTRVSSTLGTTFTSLTSDLQQKKSQTSNKIKAAKGTFYSDVFRWDIGALRGSLVLPQDARPIGQSRLENPTCKSFLGSWVMPHRPKVKHVQNETEFHPLHLFLLIYFLSQWIVPTLTRFLQRKNWSSFLVFFSPFTPPHQHLSIPFSKYGLTPACLSIPSAPSHLLHYDSLLAYLVLSHHP